MLQTFRREIKYMLPVEKFPALESRIDGLMQRDTHGVRGTYMVRSQYYDSFQDEALMDNLAGVMEKRKIRLRIYSPESDFALLEYKCKSGFDGKKYSIRITRREALAMERHRYEFLLSHKEKLALFLYARLIEGAYRPKTIVEYDRTAFVYPVSNVRVTFDRSIRGSVNPIGLFNPKPFYSALIAPDMGILEVKYNDFLPAPIKAEINKINDSAQAFSKYSEARLLQMR